MLHQGKNLHCRKQGCREGAWLDAVGQSKRSTQHCFVLAAFAAPAELDKQWQCIRAAHSGWGATRRPGWRRSQSHWVLRQRPLLRRRLLRCSRCGQHMCSITNTNMDLALPPLCCRTGRPRRPDSLAHAQAAALEHANLVQAALCANLCMSPEARSLEKKQSLKEKLKPLNPKEEQKKTEKRSNTSS